MRTDWNSCTDANYSTVLNGMAGRLTEDSMNLHDQIKLSWNILE
jgi:hypothetical protein